MAAVPGDSVLAPRVDPSAAAAPAEPGAARPDLEQLETAMESPRSRGIALTVLAVLAVLYTLYFARPFLLPITFAILLNFLLSPVIRAMHRARIPVPLAAGVVVLSLLALLGIGIYTASAPVQGWIAKAPHALATANARLRKIRSPVEQVTRTAEQVERATTVGGAPRQEVVVRGPSLVSRVFGTTEALLAGALEVIILLYFLLAAGDMFLQKLIKLLPQFEDKKKAVRIARETEASISTYLLTLLAVNVGEGLVVAGVMYLLGMPTPWLWGVLVACLEFIPYLGAITMVVVLALAGLTTFGSVGHALLVPGAFLAINLLQSNIVSPLFLSERLTLNPVAIFIGLSLWFFLWGIPGVFLAVPLLATFKIFCDHIETLAAVGEFLGRRDAEERREVVRNGAAA
ncbi:MAG TPA: AI-2E family transporter [Gemmatimonadaceae bacterium]|nr:AI-2E family transporter [Gemmatimonadaceae bacterium]